MEFVLGTLRDMLNDGQCVLLGFNTTQTIQVRFLFHSLGKV